MAAGFGTMFAKVICFATDSDVGSAGRLVETVFGELFFDVGHKNYREKSVNYAIYHSINQPTNQEK